MLFCKNIGPIVWKAELHFSRKKIVEFNFWHQQHFLNPLTCTIKNTMIVNADRHE
jgi:hypothetical protein